MLPILPRSIHGSAVMVEVAEDHGVAAEVALRGTGITRYGLADDGTEVTAEQATRIACNIVAELGPGVGLGVEIGTHYTLDTFGVWSYAIRSSPDVRTALEVALRFLELSYLLTKISLTVVGDEARLRLDATHLPPQIRELALERDGVAFVLAGRELLGQTLQLIRVESDQPGTPEDEEMLARVFLAPVTMNQQICYAAFDTALLDEPIIGHQPGLFAESVAQCEALLEARRLRSGFAGAVRSALLARPGSWTDIASIAADLHMSERTLQRRLIAERTSFRELVAEAREGLAVELLSTGMSTAEVAARLGYVEVSSFSQAFYRWRGVRPGAFRRESVTDPTATEEAGDLA